jgi:integrase
MIQFVGADRKRRSMRLGKMPQQIANAVKLRVERLNSAAIAGELPDEETARWLAKLDCFLLDKLAAVGLLPKRDSSTRLKAFLDEYILKRTDVKTTTRTNYRQAQRHLVFYFGADKRLRDITQGDGDEWRCWLLERLSRNTVRRFCGRAKQFFRAAERKRLVPASPFAGMKDCAVRCNKERDYFVTREESKRVLDACADNESRLIFALGRFGGLRCPSELLRLRWPDIDWSRGRITVHSPKTEQYEEKAQRVVPLFPELRPYLETARNEATYDGDFVIVQNRSTNPMLRKRLLDALARASIAPWPKLFQNLRTTRAIELASLFPDHVAAEWMGHNEATARKHYWRATDEDFQQALVPSENERASAID